MISCTKIFQHPVCQLWVCTVWSTFRPTFVTGPQWAWYMSHSFWMGNGYLMARMVPLEVPVKTTLPEWDTATAVWATSSAGTSLRTCGSNDQGIQKLSNTAFSLAVQAPQANSDFYFLRLLKGNICFCFSFQTSESCSNQYFYINIWSSDVDCKRCHSQW